MRCPHSGEFQLWWMLLPTSLRWPRSYKTYSTKIIQSQLFLETHHEAVQYGQYYAQKDWQKKENPMVMTSMMLYLGRWRSKWVKLNFLKFYFRSDDKCESRKSRIFYYSGPFQKNLFFAKKHSSILKPFSFSQT